MDESTPHLIFPIFFLASPGAILSFAGIQCDNVVLKQVNGRQRYWASSPIAGPCRACVSVHPLSVSCQDPPDSVYGLALHVLHAAPTSSPPGALASCGCVRVLGRV